MANIEDDVYTIAANAEPSLVRLDDARSELERVSLYADEYVEALSTDLSTAPSARNGALQARQQLERNLAAYSQLPFFPHEEELYEELRNALGPVDRSLGVVLDRAAAHDLTAARSELTQTLHPSVDRADEIIGRIVLLDSVEAQRRLAAIRTSHHRGTATALALGIFSVVLSCILSAFALRATARESTRRELLEHERTMRAVAEEAVRLRDDFLSLASHELRTPLTALQLTIQSLQRSPTGAERMLAMAERQARRLSDLVEELVDVAQIHLGRVRLARSDVDLSALVREVAASRSADAENAHSMVKVLGEDSVVGCWDRAHLAHIVSSLLSNALKFGAGSPIEVAVTRHDGAAQLTVRDHGIGIPRGRLPFLFDLFDRAAPAANFGGLGLGLYVVRALAEAHGGEARAESEEGSGSTFTVELPLAGVSA